MNNQPTIPQNTLLTSQKEHLQNSLVTKIPPAQGPFHDTIGAEAEFNHFFNILKRPVRMVLKKDIIWNMKDPLHFWLQSLAFTLRSEELTEVHVSLFLLFCIPRAKTNCKYLYCFQ